MINPKNLVAIVIDKKDMNFGKIGKVLIQDWRESGDWCIEFANGQTAIYSDKSEAEKIGENFKIRTYYRINDEFGKEADKEGWGPESFRKKYFKLKVGTNWDLQEQVNYLFK